MHDPASPPDIATNATPERGRDVTFPDIPGYRIRKRLGRGGMATVYLATQESLDRPVSIKVMEGDALAAETARQRFENEARTIARLSHPNIVAIHEVGRTIDGRLYYVMPYLASGDLSQRDLRADEARVAEVLRALLSALGYAHARGIVHRDVKRENVLFDGDDRPMLADFGIASSKSVDSRLTTAGLAMGSSSTMAPEQARGEVVDNRADLYSVGVLAWELLTGKQPYEAPEALALALMHAHDPIPRLPPELRHWQGFIDRAMAKSREARYANAQDMALALDSALRRGGDLTGRMRRVVDRSVAGTRWKLPLAIAAVAIVLVGAGLLARAYMAPAQGPVIREVVASAPMPAANAPTPTPVAPAIASNDTASPVAVPASANNPASAEASPASSASDASALQGDAASAASSPAASSSSRHASTHRARPRPRKKENFFKRLWHRL